MSYKRRIIEPIRWYRVSDQIAEKIRELVSNNTWDYGDSLPPERTLAKEFGVSRTTIRQALNVLETEGILKTIQGKGTFVLEPNPRSVGQGFLDSLVSQANNIPALLEVRKILEVEAAGLAAVRATPTAIEQIRHALGQIEEEARSGKVGDTSDYLFHYSLAKASGNPVLLAVMNTLSQVFIYSLHRSSAYKMRKPQGPQEFFEAHKAILKTVEDRDSKRARETMLKHLENVEQDYLATVDHSEREDTRNSGNRNYE